MELRAPDIETSTPRLVLEAPAALRRVRHIVGVGMGLPRHDGEVEGVVMEDDAVLVLSVCGQRPSVGVAKVTAWAHRSAQSAPEKTRRGVGASGRAGGGSYSRTSGSRRSITWRMSGTDEHTPITSSFAAS